MLVFSHVNNFSFIYHDACFENSLIVEVDGNTFVVCLQLHPFTEIKILLFKPVLFLLWHEKLSKDEHWQYKIAGRQYSQLILLYNWQIRSISFFLFCVHRWFKIPFWPVTFLKSENIWICYTHIMTRMESIKGQLHQRFTVCLQVLGSTAAYEKKYDKAFCGSRWSCTESDKLPLMM